MKKTDVDEYFDKHQGELIQGFITSTREALVNVNDPIEAIAQIAAQNASFTLETIHRVLNDLAED